MGEPMDVTKIISLDVAELEPYCTMRRTMEHRAQGIFVAEGEKVVRRLIESDLQIVSILLTQDWFDRYSNLLFGRHVEQDIFVAEKTLLEQIVGYGLHQGIMAIGRVPEAMDIFKFSSECSIPRFFVAVDGIANSENMGVIVRNCAAFGVQILISGETSCDPYLRRSVRNSMGTIFELPIAKVDDLSKTLETLQNKFAIQIIAADPKSDSENISDVDLRSDVCLVFGSEGEGISRKVIKECGTRMKIRMYHDVDSINVASSVGIILYEVVQQRGDRTSGST